MKKNNIYFASQEIILLQSSSNFPFIFNPFFSGDHTSEPVPIEIGLASNAYYSLKG